MSQILLSQRQSIQAESNAFSSETLRLSSQVNILNGEVQTKELMIQSLKRDVESSQNRMSVLMMEHREVCPIYHNSSI
jgi:hypothetical protein